MCYVTQRGGSLAIGSAAWGHISCFPSAAPASHMLITDMSKPDRLEAVADSSRRAFCTQACQTASCLALAALAQACGGSGGGTGPSNIPQLSTVNGTPNGTAVQVQIDSSSPLAAVGSAAMVRSSSGLFLVARTGDQTFTALTSTCTHQTCTITGFDGTDFVCPCHGSRFTTSGRVVNGPASAPLRTFNTAFANNVLTIG